MADGDIFFSVGSLALFYASLSFSGRPVHRVILSPKHSLRHLQVYRMLFTLMLDYTRCHWRVQVITPAVFNVVADIILFIYPFPIIFMANIPKSLRYSLLFVFALCGVVTGSAIVRVAFMTAENFLEQGNVYAYVPEL
jgi:hypothetical protein